MNGRMRGAWHPGAWIAWATGAGLAAFVTTNPVSLGLLIAVSWFVYTGCRVPGPSARSFRLFLLAALVAVTLRTALVFLGTVNAAHVAESFGEGLRLGTLLVVFGTFNAVTDPLALVRLAPRRFHEPALAAALALSITPRTVACVATVREAQRLRGLPVGGFSSLPSLAVPVLERGMEDAVTLAESMDARGHGRGRRTRYRPQGWTPAAAAVAVTSLAAGGVFLAASLAGVPALHPDPLTWPAVTASSLAAIVALALPGLLGGDRR
jgi:energy-coupling factor transport system permease protein